MNTNTYDDFRRNMKTFYEKSGPGLKNHYAKVLRIVEQQEPGEAARFLWDLYNTEQDRFFMQKALEVEHYKK